MNATDCKFRLEQATLEPLSGVQIPGCSMAESVKRTAKEHKKNSVHAKLSLLHMHKLAIFCTLVKLPLCGDAGKL